MGKYSNAVLIAEKLEKHFPGAHGQKGKNKRNIAIHKPVAAFSECSCVD
jgi:hypothetical protein